MSQPIQSVVNAFAVLEAVAGHQPVGLSETARLTGLPKTTVLRCLSTLRETGWLTASPDGRSEWALTNKALLMGMRSAPAGDLATLMQGELSAIREEVGETVHLLVRDGDAQVVVSRADGVGAIRTYLALGTPPAARCSRRCPRRSGSRSSTRRRTCPVSTATTSNGT
jgi:IclR family acetate operon transcriptional repressor